MKHQVALLTVVATACLSPIYVVAQAPVKLEITNGVTVVDGVFLNGNGPYRFMLDTGSETNQLEPEIALKLGIQSTLTFVLSTPSGKSTVRGGRLDTVTLGSMQATSQEFLLTSLTGVRNRCPGVVGTLGQEFLGKFDYVLDLQHRRLIPAAPPSTGVRVPLHMIHGRIAVPTNLGELILDSGAECMLLFRFSSQPAQASIVTSDGSLITVSTQSGRVLQIGNRLYRIDKANFAAVPGAEEAGLLPATIFRAIYVSNSGRYLLLDPKMSK